MKTIHRRDFLRQTARRTIGLAGLANLACSPSGRRSEVEKPNFVFILIDDLGWTDLGCYGSTYYETPHTDRVASQGMKFTDAYAASPVCSPTRAALLTGKHPARLGFTYISGTGGPVRELIPPKSPAGLPLSEVTIAERLKEAGYATASIGKWHLGGGRFQPEHHGFDVNLGGTQASMVESFFYPDWKQDHPDLEGGGIPVEGEPGDYLTDRLSQEATEFIEANRDQPFFLYLSHYTVHVPLQAKKDLIAKYERKLKPGQDQRHPVYAAMIESMDDSVGRVMQKLDQLGIADRTVVVFTSDNGGLHLPEPPTDTAPPTSNAPLRAGKGHLYEGGIRVPLIVRWPGVVEAGNMSNVPVSSIDFYPTLLELAGATDDPSHVSDGVSLVPLLQESGGLPRNELYWHFPGHTYGSVPSGAIRQGHYKLFESYKDGRLELYNLREDIGETHNLINELPDKGEELHQKLVNWRESVAAKMPVPNPEHDAEAVEQGSA